jgi:hypothetical protein
MAGTVTWPDAAQGVGAIVQALAILVGGGWAYFKFIRGRTFAYRGELDIESSFVKGTDAVGALRVCVTFKNTGLSQIPLNENAKQVNVYTTSAESWDPAKNVDWGAHLKLTPLFEEHDWIEAQEIVTDEVLVPVPLVHAYRLVAKVASARRRGKALLWTAETVIVRE